VLINGLILVTTATDGSAGTQIDPNAGDEVLGTRGGVRYATESVEYDGLIDHADVEVGCGGPRWHLIGGGSAGGGSASQAWQTTDRPTDWGEGDGGDVDLDPEDGWRGGGAGQSPADLKVFSLCVRDGDRSYPRRNLPVTGSSLRAGQVRCPGAAWRVTSGSIFVPTTGSWVHDSYPWDGPDGDRRPDDGWRGSVYDANAGGTGQVPVFAVCVRGEEVRYVRTGPFEVDAGAAHRHSVACRAEEHVVGGGARMGGPESVGRMVASHPSDGPDADDVPDDRWTSRVYNLSGVARQVTAFAVCLG
jgi:hypothetical protein